MTKNYPWKLALITGLISAVFAACAFAVFDSLRTHFTWQTGAATLRGLIGLLTVVILGIGIYAGMRHVKKANGGALSYGQALVAGISVGLTVGIVMMILGFVYAEYINPGYFAYMVAERQKEMAATGNSPAEIAASTADLQKQFNAATQAMQALVGQTASGIIISLVMGLFMRTKN